MDSENTLQSGEIKETTATNEEITAVKDYEEWIVAKKKGINALTASIETKIQRICELAISIVQMKNDLTDNKDALLGEKGFLDGLLREKEAAAFAILKADMLLQSLQPLLHSREEWQVGLCKQPQHKCPRN